MFRRIDDFAADWRRETETTLRVLRGLTDESLAQPIAEGRQTLGGLAWHVTAAVGTMLGVVGIPLPRAVEQGAPRPPTAAEIAAAYEVSAGAVVEAVRGAWTDEMLPEVVQFRITRVPRGVFLMLMIKHQAHHRGQMTVLMRQAGLRVPGCYGPSEEERAEMMMAAAAK